MSSTHCEEAIYKVEFHSFVGRIFKGKVASPPSAKTLILPIRNTSTEDALIALLGCERTPENEKDELFLYLLPEPGSSLRGLITIKSTPVPLTTFMREAPGFYLMKRMPLNASLFQDEGDQGLKVKSHQSFSAGSNNYYSLAKNGKTTMTKS